MVRSSYPLNPILLVDDELDALHSFEFVLTSAGMNNFIICQDSREVMPALFKAEIEVILLDLAMPHLSGEDLLSAIYCGFPEIPVIIITGANNVDTAVRCMRSGAFDYIVKPVEMSRLISSVRRAVEVRELQRENLLLKAHVLSDKLQSPETFSEIITGSACMRSIFQYIEAVSITSQPVLITGETGVGKELVARAVHTASKRTGEFVAVNVAGLDDNVFTDTLFGHKKGAFTGADHARNGLVETASGGTLFLDEIGDLSVGAQVKLLRILQERSYYPLGSDVAKRSDARIVLATNQDLKALQEGGRFRKDFYFRLRAHHVHIPPLRERMEDLSLLLDHFLEKAATQLGKKKPTPPKELLTLLATYSFPGNIRELETMVFDAVSSHRCGVLPLNSFKVHVFDKQLLHATEAKPREDRQSLSFSEELPTLRQAEDLLISEALRRSNGNQAIAAMMLGITRQALNRRLRLSGQ